MKTCLTIAGSDSSGGAGIQADIKTMTMLGVYATSAITALTAQNTLGVSEIFEVTPKFLEKQIDAVFEDIPPDSVKIGMIFSKNLAEKVAERMKFFNAKNIVADPVMIATSGAKLIDDDAIKILEKKIFPLAKIITPNIPEAEKISGKKIKNVEDMEFAAKIIFEKFGCAVLCKGGHNLSDANDVFFDKSGVKIFYGKRIETKNTHGTGCTLSSAIAANLAKNFSLIVAIEQAKKYLSGALSAKINLGKGCGPMKHNFLLD